MSINRVVLCTHGDTNLPTGMLSSPHIAYCVQKYKIIEGYEKECLGSATYNMRIGGSILTWIDGEKIEFELGDKDNKNENISKRVNLKPNSLTFVTTIEKFNLPRDIIARFNLKSKWVHEGLLLGTGPIVNPELKANLLIPLHNFSSQDVSLNYGDELISVEFTKTLNPDQKINNEFKYIPNKNKDFDFHKYRNRIGGKKVESSVLYTLQKHGKTIRNLNIAGVIAAITTLAGLAGLVIASWSLWKSSVDTMTDASNIVKESKQQNIDFRSFALKSSTNELQNEITLLKKSTDELNNRIRYTPSAFKIREDLEQIKNRIETLEKKIK